MGTSTYWQKGTIYPDRRTVYLVMDLDYNTCVSVIIWSVLKSDHSTPIVPNRSCRRLYDIHTTANKILLQQLRMWNEQFPICSVTFIWGRRFKSISGSEKFEISIFHRVFLFQFYKQCFCDRIYGTGLFAGAVAKIYF